jgi:hypothetical protein
MLRSIRPVPREPAVRTRIIRLRRSPCRNSVAYNPRLVLCAKVRGNLAPGPSDAAAVAGDFDLRDLRRDQPGVETVACTVLAAGDARPQLSKETILT